MEQNIQEQTAGHRGYLLRTESGNTGKDSCIACLFGEGMALPVDYLQSLMRTHEAPLVACYFKPDSISHYGTVDQLAPAGAMQDFVAHVESMEREEAGQVLCGLDQADGKTEIHVLHQQKEWESIVQRLKATFGTVLILTPENN